MYLDLFKLTYFMSFYFSFLLLLFSVLLYIRFYICFLLYFCFPAIYNFMFYFFYFNGCPLIFRTHTLLKHVKARVFILYYQNKALWLAGPKYIPDKLSLLSFTLRNDEVKCVLSTQLLDSATISKVFCFSWNNF